MTDTARLGLYMHWPYCAHICPYCDFNVYRPKGDPDALITAMIADMRHWRTRTGGRPLASLHFGGGTPSLLDAAQLDRLIEAADQIWGFATGAEIGLEANPNDAPRFAAFSAAGINRLSLGIQSFQDAALRRLGRDHDAAEGLSALDGALTLFPHVSLDLIYAFAGQTLADWEAELDTAFRSGAGHVSPYQLTIEARTAFGKRAERGEKLVHDNDTAAAFYALTEALGDAAGFAGYEISNLARDDGAQSRHNRLYWDGDDWIGIGPGAHGRLGQHASGGRFATEAHRRPADYIDSVAASGSGVISWDRLDAGDEAAERILMGLRVATGLDRQRLRAATGLDIDPDGLARMLELGLVSGDGQRIGLTQPGRVLADAVSGELVA